MNIYYRILKYAGPIRKRSLYYFCAIFLSIFFGLTTYGLVIPLLKVLFEQKELSHSVLEQPSRPQLQISIAYITRLFYHYFLKIVQNNGKIPALYFLAFLFVLSNFLSNLFRYIADINMARVRISVVYNLRLELYKRMLNFPLSYFTDTKKGDLIARIVTDIQEVEHAVADALRVFLKEPTQLFCYIMVLCNLSLKLTLFTLCFLPLAGWIIAEIIKRLQRWAHKTQQSLSDIIHLLEETLTGIRIIKIFNAQRYVIQKFQKNSRLYSWANMSVARKEYMTGPISSSLSVVVVAIILAYGGHLILLENHGLTASVFIAYIIICSQLLIPIKMFSTSIAHIQRGLVAAKRIFHLLDESLVTTDRLLPFLKDRVHTQSFSSSKNKNLKKLTFNHEIAFKHVSFSYTGHTQTLQDVIFTIRKGETVALVGASGSGKSTILALLLGLYQPNSGTIEIDGIPLSQIDEDVIHCIMGMVTQEPILFHDTVYNNISFNRENCTESVIVEAAKLAFAHDFIMTLPQDYQTMIGSHGDKLSGGQKQRICIARAILSQPPILVLDEATSALDTASERNVQEGLQSLIKNRTSIIVAHRFSTIAHADKIIVLDEGKIVEQGTHADLLEKGGLYQKLFLLQQSK